MPSKQREQRAPESERKRVGDIPGFSNERETAEELGVALRTLRKWRAEGKGPPFIKFARQIHYPDQHRAEWLKRRVVEPTREQTAA